jgi:hypothetical protein
LRFGGREAPPATLWRAGHNEDRSGRSESGHRHPKDIASSWPELFRLTAQFSALAKGALCNRVPSGQAISNCHMPQSSMTAPYSWRNSTTNRQACALASLRVAASAPVSSWIVASLLTKWKYYRVGMDMARLDFVRGGQSL